MNAVKDLKDENTARDQISKSDQEKENAVGKVGNRSNIIPFIIAVLVITVALIMWPKIKAWYLARKLRAESDQQEVSDV
jgi:hypothetical protein